MPVELLTRPEAPDVTALTDEQARQVALAASPQTPHAAPEAPAPAAPYAPELPLQAALQTAPAGYEGRHAVAERRHRTESRLRSVARGVLGLLTRRGRSETPVPTTVEQATAAQPAVEQAAASPFTFEPARAAAWPSAEQPSADPDSAAEPAPVAARAAAAPAIIPAQRASREFAMAAPGSFAPAPANTAPAPARDLADTAAPFIYNTPAATEDVRQPIAPRLQYPTAQKERLQTYGPGWKEGNDFFEGLDLEPSMVPLNAHQPLLTKEQVAEQLGPGFENFGALLGVIHLPHAKEPLYIFDRSTVEVAADGKEDYITRIVGASPTQLGKMRTNIDIGQPDRGELKSELLILNNTTTGKYRATIGTEGWLPGRPDGAKDPSAPVPEQYKDVDGEQVEIYITGEPGTVFVYEKDPRFPSTVEFNAQYITPQDPYQGGPAESFPGEMIRELSKDPADRLSQYRHII